MCFGVQGQQASPAAGEGALQAHPGHESGVFARPSSRSMVPVQGFWVHLNPDCGQAIKIISNNFSESEAPVLARSLHMRAATANQLNYLF